MRIIGGMYRGKKLSPPTSQKTRPTSDRVREMIFNVLFHNPLLGPNYIRGKAVLDGFAGTGSLGLEAFSRGATSVLFIESSPEVLPLLYANLESLHCPREWVLEQDILTLGSVSTPFDLVFLDPPYGKNLILPTLGVLSEKGWLAPQALIIIEIGKQEPLSLPPFLSLLLERQEGAAKILFCKHCG